jgi:hypothetical protein
MLKKKSPSEGSANSVSLLASVFFASLHFLISAAEQAEIVPGVFLAEEIILAEKIRKHK